MKISAPLKRSILIIFIVLFLDQFLKIWIKTTMYLGQEIPVFGNWFIIHFTENNGMAFGMEFAGGFGKLFLSIFRIIAVSFIGWYLFKLSNKKETPFVFILSISLIFAGAVGNILDSAFYGILFNESAFQIATFMPEEGGYAGFLHGKVVDMFYFPIIHGTFPSWFPIWKGEEFEFFRPVFNISDTSITIGVLALIIFQRNFFNKENFLNQEEDTTVDHEILDKNNVSS